MSTKDINLAAESYWDEGYDKFTLVPMPDDYITVKLIHKYCGNNNTQPPKSVLEIGVYPGRFMYHFGKLNYILNGIDQTKYLPRLEEWLKKNNFKTGDFIQADINTVDTSKKYDVVFSAGFIEHFPKFEEMIALHAAFTQPGGLLFITAPNFGGSIQHRLHKWLDKENLDRHYVPAMDISKWRTVLLQNNFHIIFSGYTGGVDFWVGDQKRNAAQKILLKLVKWILPLAKKINLPDSRAYSPECVIVAQKKQVP